MVGACVPLCVRVCVLVRGFVCVCVCVRALRELEMHPPSNVVRTLRNESTVGAERRMSGRQGRPEIHRIRVRHLKRFPSPLACCPAGGEADNGHDLTGRGSEDRSVGTSCNCSGPAKAADQLSCAVEQIPVCCIVGNCRIIPGVPALLVRG